MIYSVFRSECVCVFRHSGGGGGCCIVALLTVNEEAQALFGINDSAAEIQSLFTLVCQSANLHMKQRRIHEFRLSDPLYNKNSVITKHAE